ncbi:MAG: hypothetical protein PQJ61_02395 [Spirochaetales bacterium]|uniref:DUF1207 domain-containing protein n=1 Tax=Candidatus Thalassospirochaeta sargassi TaxID=3119039 RepID=A0AAJ1IAB2_9SPIO|nr:hypothetical protein [Spirochaetales bacterium]
MKNAAGKISILILFLFLNIRLFASDTSFHIPVGEDWEFRPFSLEHLYPNYLADPLSIRVEAAVQTVYYADYDYADTVNESGSYTGRLAIFPGFRLSLLQFVHAKTGFGIEGEIGAVIPTYMRSTNNDVIALDGIYYFRVNSKITPWWNINFSKHHNCTHLGDEYPVDKVESPIDYDPNRLELPVLDDFRLANAFRPLHFLTARNLDILTLYGEIGFFLPGTDFLGERQNKPDRWAFMNYLWGVELEYYLPDWGENIGGFYAALNVSYYQQNGYSPNLSVKSGWILPQDRDGFRFRIGFQYYNGRSTMNHFYDRKEIFTAIYLSTDF